MSSAIPEKARMIYRIMRANLLSLGLDRAEKPPMTEEERHSSGMISVVVAVHDSLDVTRRCLNSLEQYGGGAEIIIVDDGSKLETVRQLLDVACSRNGWKLLRNEKASGHSRASEAGAAIATRPYICLLNSDTVVTPRSWYGIARAFEVSPKIAVAGPSTSQTPTAQEVRRALFCRRHWSDEQIWSFAERYTRRHHADPIVDLPVAGGFAFFVRRSIWDQMKGFDKNLADYGNETELCRRLLREGYRIAWSRASYIHHLGSESYGKTLGIKTIRERCLEADSYIDKKMAFQQSALPKT